MFQVIQNILNLGTKNLALDEQRIVRLINGISLIGIVATLFSEIYVLSFLGFYPLGLSVAVSSILVFLSSLYLNAIGKSTITKYIVVAFLNLTIVSVHFLLANETGIYVMLINSFAVYIAIFKERKVIVWLCLLTGVAIMLSLYFQSLPRFQPLIIFTGNQALTIKIVFYITSISLVLFITLFLKSNQEYHQKKLEKALEEKNELLKEVHHRVKNNLQVVSSLFNIQKRRLTEEQKESREVIEAGQNRIQAMVLIHQELYKNNNIENVGVKNYLERIITQLTILYKQSNSQVGIEYESVDEAISMDKAISLGLILNEALTNSFKYAFLESNQGTINIIFSKSGGEYKLKIIDDGIGLNIEDKEKSGIGMQLIKNMASQLNGTYHLTSEKGTSHTITFEA